jgi:PTH1 family peptidyl-tRNA hydrolase
MRLFYIIMKYLIVGLGNPGPEYEDTRHNIGFLILDHIAAQLNMRFEDGRHGQIAEARYAGRKLVFLKPNTYMNLSGKAVRYWIEAEKIKAEQLLIVTDDLALPFGKIRLRNKGSDGGHNGLKDINLKLGRTNYPRLRFGIGNEFLKGQQVDYVLSSFDESQEILNERIGIASDAIKSFVRHGLQQTMTKFNAL